MKLTFTTDEGKELASVLLPDSAQQVYEEAYNDLGQTLKAMLDHVNARSEEIHVDNARAIPVKALSDAEVAARDDVQVALGTKAKTDAVVAEEAKP